MSVVEVAAIIGAVTGSISLSFLVIKSMTNKPKLAFEQGLKNFYPARDNNAFTVIVIRMKVHNRGTKSTTIHHSKLTFDYNSEQKEIKDDRSSLEIFPNSTVDYAPNLNVHESKLILYKKITNCVLTITHTHGKIVIKLGIIEENKD